MSVTPQDVEKVALLARLTISESELPEVTERFSRVLNLVDELKKLPQSRYSLVLNLEVALPGLGSRMLRLELLR